VKSSTSRLLATLHGVTGRSRFVLLSVVLAALAAAVALGLRVTRVRAPVWSPSGDGWEQTHLQAPNGGPVYVRRRVSRDHCLFGDFPESGEVPVVQIACGETWHGTENTFSLTCECLPLP
jgi:hypothetical protein